MIDTGLRSALVERARSRPLALLAAAIVCGFGMAAIGITLVRAADDTGLLDVFRNDYLNRTARAFRLPGAGDRDPEARLFASPRRSPAARRREPLGAYANAARRGPNIRKSPKGAPVHEAGRSAPGSGSARTVCVRTCDGYVFPVGALRAQPDMPAHLAACAAACPGAATALYTLPPGLGLDDPGNARSVADGSRYRQLQTAMLFRRERVSACSCTGPDHVAALLPIERDPTLRSGDVVVGRTGEAHAYAGNGATPHRRRDFAGYRISPALRPASRAQVDRVVGTSQREAIARAYAKSLRTRQASLDATAFAEIRPPAGSASGVRVYQPTLAAGSVDPSGVRVISLR